MSRNNDVFQVLIPTSEIVAPAGTTLDALALGQLGAFSYETNKAIDAPVGKFYWAVGVDSTGANATKNDIVKSAGTHIQSKNIVSLTSKCYQAPVNKVVELGMKVMQCGDEVGFKVEIRNQEAYRLNGYNQVVKNFVVPTSECDDCATECADGNCADVLQSLVDLVNADEDGLFTAAIEGAVDCEAPTGAIRLTVKAAEFQDFCKINLGYFFPHQTDIIVTAFNGFEEATTITEMVYEDGSGYDIKQLEYEAGGWNGKPGPYRTYADGLAKDDFQYFADPTKKYDVIQLAYDQVSVSGWRSDSHNLRTVIATESTGAISENIQAFVNTMTAGYVDAITPCDNTP